VYASGNLRVDPARLSVDALHDAIDAGWPTFDDGWSGLHAFLAAAAGRTAPIKVQLAGPVTLALAFAQSGMPIDDALHVSTRAVQARAGALCRLVAERLPGTPVVAFLDEPGLVAFGTDRLPVEANALADIVSGALAALQPSAATAVHCCGPTDWRVVTLAGPDIVSLPVAVAVAAGVTIADFLDRGGWVAWGVVPTDGPVAEAEHHWRALTSAWCELTALGCEPNRLRQQALLTPECGLCGHGRTQAEHSLALVARMSHRAEDHALATRLAIGA
jgi:methionine synthase II (cobalamin-independent)